MAQATCELDRDKIISAVRSVRLTLVKYLFKDGSYFHCIGFSILGKPREVFKVSEYMMPRLMGELQKNYRTTMTSSLEFYFFFQNPPSSVIPSF